MDNRAQQLQPEPVPDAARNSLTPERWRQIKEVFGRVLDCKPTARDTVLQEACGGDESLRAEVQSLLAAAGGNSPATSEMFHSVVSPLTQQLHPNETEDPMLGRRVGAYRLERRVGYGGMASVYLAARADDEYRKQVAIKLLRPDLDNTELLKRFRAERQTLARLDHPNIVKLLDGGSTAEGLPFLVMDYVDGRPIDEYCDANRLTIERRLRLFCAVCEAVRCAHRCQVIHRDLKPSNILVTDDGTPKLLDFGIAKVLAPPDPSQALVTLTATRHLTPAYASPEQVRGEPVTPATDVYSLGVVLYELLTGHRPYRLKQRTPAELERAICEQDPESPSTAIDRVESEKLPDGTTATRTAEDIGRTREAGPAKLRRNLRGDLDNILLKALQKDAKRRYAKVEEFEHDIQCHINHRPVQARPSTFAYRVSKFVTRHKSEVIASAAVMLVVLGAVGFSAWEQHRAAEKARAEILNQRSGGRRSVAVLGFKNLSERPDTGWLSSALAEMLTTELSMGGKLRLIPGEDVAQTRINLSLPDMDSFNSTTLRRIYKNLASDFVVAGSYVEMGEGPRQVRLDLRVQDAASGDTVAVVAANGEETDLPGLIARAGATLRQKLGVEALTSGEAAQNKASLPANPEAARLYAEGLRKQRLYDFLGARYSLEKAVAADPNFALAHVALSDAWASYGDSKRAQEEAKKAFDLSAGLPREQGLMVEARYYEALHQWDKAIDIRRTLFNFFPDNLNHGLELVGTESAAGKGADSLDTIAALRKLPAPDRDDPRIDLAESKAANVVSDYKRQAAAAVLAVQKAHAIGARLVVAPARILEARAYMEMGQKDKVAPALSEAQEIYQAVGDRFHAARVLQQAGLAYYYQGKLDEARKTYEQALAIQRELGNRSNQARVLNGIAMVMQDQDDLDGARHYYLQALALCREVDDRAMTGTVLGNLGGIEFSQGDFKGARAHLQESLDIARRVGEQSGIALELGNLGQAIVAEGNPRDAVALYKEAVQISRKTGKNKDLTTILIQRGDLQLQLGELSEARSSYQEVLQISTTAGDQQGKGMAMRSLGQIQFERGELAAARKSYEQAQATLGKVADTRFVEDLRMAFAELDLEDGHVVDAEHESQQAAEEFRKAKDPEDVASAQTLLARVLLAQGKNEEALRTVADAIKIASKGGSRNTQMNAACAEAEARTASGRAAVAEDTLKQLVSESLKAGFVPTEFEARLGLGEAEMKAGHSAAGRVRLASLEHDARAKGFLLIARKAAASRNIKKPRNMG
jgi:serine/threonine protein kinase/tetratricopeptide (TPR) repeat protein